MQTAATTSRRRKSVGGPSTPQDVVISNQTSNHFLGTTQRSWMSGSFVIEQDNGRHVAKERDTGADTVRKARRHTSLSNNVSPSSHQINTLSNPTDQDKTTTSSTDNGDANWNNSDKRKTGIPGHRLSIASDTDQQIHPATSTDVEAGETLPDAPITEQQLPDPISHQNETNVTETDVVPQIPSHPRPLRLSPIPESATVARLRTDAPNQLTETVSRPATTIYTVEMLDSPVSATDVRRTSPTSAFPSTSIVSAQNPTKTSSGHLITPVASPRQTNISRKRSFAQIDSHQPLMTQQRVEATPTLVTNRSPSLGMSNGPTIPHNGQQTIHTLPHNSAAWNGTNQHPPQISTSTQSSSFLGLFEKALSETTVGTPINQPTGIRAEWIREACRQNDDFLLLLHQLNCLWSRDRATFYQRFGLSNACEEGFKLFQALFGYNLALPPQLLNFLAATPNPPEALDANPEVKRWISLIGQFLSELGPRWNELKGLCLKRKYPPSAQELEAGLLCPTSTVLQKAFFSSVDRQIFPGSDDLWVRKSYEFFQADQRQLEIRRRLSPTSLANPQLQLRYLHHFGHAYQQYHAEHVKQLLARSGATLTQNEPVYSRPLPSQNSPYMPVVQQPRNFQGSKATSNNVATPQNSGIGLAPMEGVEQLRRPTQIPYPGLPAGFRASSRTVNLPRVPEGRQLTSNTLTNPASMMPQPRLSSHQTASTVHNANVPVLRSNFWPDSRHQQQQSQTVPRPATFISPSDPLSRENTLQHNPQYANSRLLPPLHQNPPVFAHPDPSRIAIHQAHLFTPTGHIRGEPDTVNDLRLYPYTRAYALRPVGVSSQVPFLKISFDLPKHTFDRIVRYVDPVQGGDQLNPKRYVADGLLLYHIRAVQVAKNSEAADGSAWCSLPTTWPQHCFISIDDNHLELRRKRNFKRDLPIDITKFVHIGKNNITISIHPLPSEEDKVFLIAVEILELCTHEKALQMSHTISPKESLAFITNSLKSKTGDDELEIVGSHVNIDLIDPFMSKMVQTPVRGRQCRHRECFDREVFLQSRTSDTGDGLTEAYQWLCPYCKKDARPSTLVIDGFLQDVVKDLMNQGKTDVRSIRVQEDGTWHANSAEKHDEKVENKTPGKDQETHHENGDSKIALPKLQLTVPGPDAATKETFPLNNETNQNNNPVQTGPMEIIELD